MNIEKIKEKIDEIHELVYSSECSKEEYYLFLGLLKQLKELLNIENRDK